MLEGSYNCMEIKSNGVIIFHKLSSSNLKKFRSMVGGNISLLYSGEDFPCKRNRELPFVVFADDDGMHENLPMNQVANPLLPDYVLIQCARFGGPFGTLVFFLEENPRSSMDLNAIKDTFVKYSEEQETDEWKDVIMKAVNSEGELIFA